MEMAEYSKQHASTNPNEHIALDLLSFADSAFFYITFNYLYMCKTLQEICYELHSRILKVIVQGFLLHYWQLLAPSGTSIPSLTPCPVAAGSSAASLLQRLPWFGDPPSSVGTTTRSAPRTPPRCGTSLEKFHLHTWHRSGIAETPPPPKFPLQLV